MHEVVHFMTAPPMLYDDFTELLARIEQQIASIERSGPTTEKIETAVHSTLCQLYEQRRNLIEKIRILDPRTNT